MILELLVAAVAGASAVLAFRTRSRCAAVWLESERIWNGREYIQVEKYKGRCKSPADPRCGGGNCTAHCRDPARCNALCIRPKATPRALPTHDDFKGMP